MRVKELKFDYRGELIRVPVKDIWGYSIRNAVSQYADKGRVETVPGLSYLTLRLDRPARDIEVCCSNQPCWEPTLNFLIKMRREYENSNGYNRG